MVGEEKFEVDDKTRMSRKMSASWLTGNKTTSSGITKADWACDTRRFHALSEAEYAKASTWENSTLVAARRARAMGRARGQPTRHRR